MRINRNKSFIESTVKWLNCLTHIVYWIRKRQYGYLCWARSFGRCIFWPEVSELTNERTKSAHLFIHVCVRLNGVFCMCVCERANGRARKKKPTKPNMLICFSESIEVRTLSRSPTYAHIQLISKPKPKLKLKSKPKPTKQYRISPLTRLTVARTSRKRAKL